MPEEKRFTKTDVKYDLIMEELRKTRQDINTLTTRVIALGTACHNAFLQIREATCVLRDDIGEYAGNVVYDPWDES